MLFQMALFYSLKWLHNISLYMVLYYFHGIFYSKVWNYVSNNFHYEENGKLLIENRGKNLRTVVSVKNSSLKNDS